MVARNLRPSEFFTARAPLTYLKSISECDVASVLEFVLGEAAKKLTPAVLGELKKSWTREFKECNSRYLSTVTYLFADGNYQEICGVNPKICVLVLMGVDDHGRKHLIAIEDGVHEYTQS